MIFFLFSTAQLLLVKFALPTHGLNSQLLCYQIVNSIPRPSSTEGNSLETGLATLYKNNKTWPTGWEQCQLNDSVWNSLKVTKIDRYLKKVGVYNVRNVILIKMETLIRLQINERYITFSANLQRTIHRLKEL